MVRAFVSSIFLLFMMVQPLTAESIRELTWDHLVPQTSKLEDPFSHLKLEQLYDLEELAYLTSTNKKALGSPVSKVAEQVVELTDKLKKEGLNAEALLKEYMDLFAEIDRRNQAVVGDLDGKTVRIPGYALPLEFSETGVQEFLLVPNIGACIHTPPPPPNQMVFVKLNQIFKADDLYLPVWVTGRLSVEQSSQELEFVDGANNITAGYVLDAANVTPYEDK